MPGHQRCSGVLVDYGGGLTAESGSSFADGCGQGGLDSEAAKELFRANPEALAELRRLETGEADPADFERRFGELLGTEPEGLIEGLFAGLAPARPMIGAVGAAREAGVPT